MPSLVAHIDQDAIKVVRRLSRAGHTAYLVGGCVRDLLLGRRPKDFDIATSARPGDVRELFRNSRIIGRRFRLVHVLFGGNKVFEVATFRRDPIGTLDSPEEWDPDAEAPRPPKASEGDLLIRQDNTFGEAWEDAARRDFTLNALFYDLEREEVVDYVGGLAELERRVLRTIGEPDIRFREDPVRILRALKFAARLDLGLEYDVYDAMVLHRDELLRAARPRLLEELLRLLRGGAARRSIWLAWETGCLGVLLPELSTLLDDDGDGTIGLWKRLAAVDERTSAGSVPSDAVLLSALLQDPAEEQLATHRDAMASVTEFLGPITERLAWPRRLLERVRVLLAVQPRLRAGRVGSLSRRDFFLEATELLQLSSDEAPNPAPASASDAPPRRARHAGQRNR